MNKPVFKIYPSGFIGSAAAPSTKSVDVSKLKDRLFDLSAIANPDGHTASMEVTQLWDEVIGATCNQSSFEFRERVLRCAYSAFGTSNVYEWLSAQKLSPYYSEYHVRWIDETLLYVLGSVPRTYSVHNWTQLLKLVSAAAITVDSSVVKYYILNGNALSGVGVGSGNTAQGSERYTDNLDFATLLQKWCTQAGGVDDLMASLYLLFGQR